MHLSPEIKELCRAPARQIADQQRAVAARDAWREAPANAQLIRELEAYGADQADAVRLASPEHGAAPINTMLLSPYPTLHRLFRQPGAALALARRWCRPVLGAMCEAPLSHAAFRHMHANDYTVIQLYQTGRAELSLVLVAGEQRYHQREQDRLCFADIERYEAVLTGKALLRLTERGGPDDGPAHFTFRPLLASEGITISRIGPRQAQTVDAVDGYMLRLRLTRCPQQAEPAREYSLCDGALIRQSAGQRADSQQELAMAALAAMQHKPSAPAIAAIAAGSGADHLRWEAVRQGLVLDTASGFTALSEIADQNRDPLSRPAQKLRAQLLTAHPQLETLLCPA